jgi:hypothetical protein
MFGSKTGKLGEMSDRTGRRTWSPRRAGNGWRTTSVDIVSSRPNSQRSSSRSQGGSFIAIRVEHDRAAGATVTHQNRTGYCTSARKSARSSICGDPGWASSNCRPTSLISTRSKPGQTSMARRCPTCASTRLPKRTKTQNGVFVASDGSRTWRSHSCTTLEFPYDQSVTLIMRDSAIAS